MRRTLQEEKKGKTGEGGGGTWTVAKHKNKESSRCGKGAASVQVNQKGERGELS